MDYYKILGVNKNANQDEIKKAFRKMASATHPDKGGDNTSFQKVEQAYRILSDSKKRQEYDYLNSNNFDNLSSIKDNVFQDFFEYFSKQQQTKSPQQIFRTQITISLEDSYFGRPVVIKLQTHFGQKIIEIQIPKGITNNQQLRINNVIDNSVLIAEILIRKHLKFDVRGNDLITNYPVSVLDLISGTTDTFKNIRNEDIEVVIPPLTQPYYELRIKNNGMPIYNNFGYGDQILLLKPFIPATISKEIIEFIKTHKERK